MIIFYRTTGMLLLEKLSELTPIETAFWGGSAVIGIPLIFNFMKDIYFDKRKRKEEQAYISVQLIFLLEKFVAKCADVSWDRGYDPQYPEPEVEEFRAQAEDPVFDLSSVKGEYKYLSPTLLYKLHNIDIKLHQAKDEMYAVGDNWGFSPDGYYAYYEQRRKIYGDIGFYVADIAEQLRKEFKIEKTEGWEPKQRIINSMSNIKQEKSQQALRRMENKSRRIMSSRHNGL